MNTAALDRVFGALSDPTRRDMLARLADGETNVGTLAEPYSISQPAVSKHLRVLENAGLIERTRHGRRVHIRVDPRPLEEARNWIAHYARFWEQHFDAVDRYLETHGLKNPPPPPEGDPSP